MLAHQTLTPVMHIILPPHTPPLRARSPSLHPVVIQEGRPDHLGEFQRSRAGERPTEDIRTSTLKNRWSRIYVPPLAKLEGVPAPGLYQCWARGVPAPRARLLRRSVGRSLIMMVALRVNLALFSAFIHTHQLICHD